MQVSSQACSVCTLMHLNSVCVCDVYCIQMCTQVSIVHMQFNTQSNAACMYKSCTCHRCDVTVCRVHIASANCARQAALEHI